MRFLSITTVFLISCLFCSGPIGAEDIFFLAGAGLRQPVDKLVEVFCERTGNNVFVDYAGSGHLITRITASGRGDLFMPGSTDYIQRLEQDNRVVSCRNVVLHTPVIGVNRKSSKKILCFSDLALKGVRIAMGDPKAMAFGRVAMDILERSGKKNNILKNVVVYGATVKQLALYVAQGDVDAAIIGRADAFQYEESIKIIPISETLYEPEIIAIALLKSGSDQTEARKFFDFMSSSEAIETFKSFEFLPIESKD